MCSICGLPDYTRCSCETTQPFCDQCSEDSRCAQIMDTDCVIYHPDDDKVTKLTCLAIPNKTNLSTILEAIDRKICQFTQVQLNVQDTPTINHTLIGKTLTSDVIISPDEGNQLQARSTGLYGALQLESFKVKIDSSDAPDYLENQIVGGTDGIVTVSVIKQDGLLVVQPALDILCLLNAIKSEYLEEFCALADSCKCFNTVTNLEVTFIPACPDGYTLNPDTNQCEQISTTTPTFSGEPVSACNSSNKVYNTLGSILYVNGFKTDGTGIGSSYSSDLAAGNIIQMQMTNSVWTNTNSGTALRGPINRIGLWECGSSGVTNSTLGFIIPIEVSSTKTYYIGIAGDDAFRLDVNGTTVINRPAPIDAGFTTVDNYYNVGSSVNFLFFNIYPITLNAGINYLYLIGRDTGGIASTLAAEVYDATPAQLQNAAFVPAFNQDDPDNQTNVPYSSNYYSNINLIFTTRCGRNPGTIFTYNGADDPCPAGYNLDTSGGTVLTAPCQGLSTDQDSWICKRMLTSPFSGYTAVLVFDKIIKALTYEVEYKLSTDPDTAYAPVSGSPFSNQAGTIVTLTITGLPSENVTFRVRPNYGDCYGDWVTV